MAKTIKGLNFPGIIAKDMGSFDAVMSAAQAANSIEHCKINRYRHASIFCLGLLFGAVAGYCGAWIIIAIMNGG